MKILFFDHMNIFWKEISSMHHLIDISSETSYQASYSQQLSKLLGLHPLLLLEKGVHRG